MPRSVMLLGATEQYFEAAQTATYPSTESNASPTAYWVHSSMVERGIADPSVAGSNPVVPSFTTILTEAVLWCNWLALWTLNPAIRVQIPVGPLLQVACFNQSLHGSVGRALGC